MIFGLILIGLGVWFLIDQYVPAIDTDLLWPVALVVLGIVLLVRRPATALAPSSSRPKRANAAALTATSTPAASFTESAAISCAAVALRRIRELEGVVPGREGSGHVDVPVGHGDAPSRAGRPAARRPPPAPGRRSPAADTSTSAASRRPRRPPPPWRTSPRSGSGSGTWRARSGSRAGTGRRRPPPAAPAPASAASRPCTAHQMRAGTPAQNRIGLPPL